MIKNPKFMESLVARGILTEKDSVKLSDLYRGDHFAVLQRLCRGVRGGLAGKADVAKLWGDSLSVPYIELTKSLFQEELVQKLTENFARENKVIFVYKFGDVITAATATPLNKTLAQNLERMADCKVSLVFSLPDEITDAIDIHYKSVDNLDELTSIFKDRSGLDIYLAEDKEISKADLNKIAGSEAIVELSRGILLFALKEGASDVHIEPQENHLRVRFRVDGVLHDKLKLEKTIQLPLISRYKIMSNMDITERRRPQDGSLSLALAQRAINFRISTTPAVYGEKIVLRALGQLGEKNIPDLEELDLSYKNLNLLRNLIATPNGVIFVTGPTGSGKTTTLFSMLKSLNQTGVNIMTIEDPVEYQLPGINQIQVNHHIGLTFISALRGFLRQDPDVILVGEVRDMETAKIASQAALTGHLVMTTMHTNNSFQAVTRLVEIGVEPFLVAPSVIGVMAQRLVRKLCSSCKAKYALSAEEKLKYFVCDPGKEVFFFRSSGCVDCGHTGYKGRIALHEVFIIDDKCRELIADGASILKIQKLAFETGFQTIRYDGIKKVLRGLTTIEEVDRVALE